MGLAIAWFWFGSMCKSPQVSWKKMEGSEKVGPERIEAILSTELRINAGVLLFRGSSIRESLDKWSSEFENYSSKFPDTGNYSINDQGCLRQLIERRQLNCEFVDPRIYNAIPFIYYPLEL